jgi:hypothetical protein
MVEGDGETSGTSRDGRRLGTGGMHHRGWYAGHCTIHHRGTDHGGYLNNNDNDAGNNHNARQAL